MANKLKQIWHHIEDHVHPSEIQQIRQVMDIYFKGNHFEVDLSDYRPEKNKGIFGLHIKGRNPEMELAFIHENEKIFVNLEGYNWPKEINNPNYSARKHAKLEIKYFESNPNFVWNKGGYRSFIRIWAPIRPEFSITLPKGMEMKKKDGKFFSLLVLMFAHRKKVTFEGDLNLSLDRIVLCCDNGIKEYSLDKWDSLKIKDPTVTKIDEKKIYTYVIDEECYNDIFNLNCEKSKIMKMKFRGSYLAVYNWRFWGVPSFGVILILFSVVELHLFLEKLIQMPDFSFLITLFSYSLLVLELYRENYETPSKNFTLAAIVISVIIMVVILIMAFCCKKVPGI